MALETLGISQERMVEIREICRKYPEFKKDSMHDVLKMVTEDVRLCAGERAYVCYWLGIYAARAGGMANPVRVREAMREAEGWPPENCPICLKPIAAEPTSLVDASRAVVKAWKSHGLGSGDEKLINALETAVVAFDEQQEALAEMKLI